MKLLVVTNLYPPQELGGYGRCISDFVWGLIKLHHEVHVLSSDAPYLNFGGALGPSYEPVYRTLTLKGSYENGVSVITDFNICASIDSKNVAAIYALMDQPWDGFIVGNLDLLGIELLPALLSTGCPVLHHVGFTTPPYPSKYFPNYPNYHLIPASNSVKLSLCDANFPVSNSPIVFPGVRLEYFSPDCKSISPSLEFALSSLHTGSSLATPSNPLKIGFAGLLMASKGVHTIVKALIELHNRGFSIQVNIAGSCFQSGYQEKLESMLASANISDRVRFVGNLNRLHLARFWSLHHIGVFPSIQPEAFGISAAEIMASGTLLLSTGVGGAAELFDDQLSGVRFLPNNHISLTESIISLIKDPSLLHSIAQRGKTRAFSVLSVQRSARLLEDILIQNQSCPSKF